MSEQYQALYRKYRPQSFDDVVGRDAIVKTLKNQVRTGRIGHSYLLCGTRGTGKTTIAKIFARAVNCENPQNGNPCGECPTCKAIAEGANLNVIEMDAASNNGVDDIRTIIDEVSYSPTSGRFRVYIIDEVHMLSTAAFNALLKTLEEPPSYAIFILATTEPNKLPLTILSRCQRYDFGRLSTQTIADRLQDVCEREKIRIEEKAVQYLARRADGSLRDGLSLLDQCEAFFFEEELSYDKVLSILGAADTSIFHRLFLEIHTCDAAAALKTLEEVLLAGKEMTQFVTDFVWYLRSLMLLKASEDAGDLLDVSTEDVAQMTEDARRAEMSEIMRDIRILSALIEQIRYAADRRTLTEMAILRLCTAAMEEEPAKGMEALQERLRQLEEAVSQGAVVTSFAQGGQKKESAAKEEDELSPEAMPQLTEAVPEDIRQIVKEWSKILSTYPAQLLKSSLQEANLSLGEGGKLLVVFNNAIVADMFMQNEDHRKEFEEHLSKCTGKIVPVEYRCLDKGRKFKDNYVDLKQVIRMEIQTEDE
ncbi:MAG: DNA polymerase III subunit gamma/tau [Lachnospiraceae bacterium]|nr:DNA polymerase III subunit gamma/tau [Lachnospiraceae bacterium]